MCPITEGLATCFILYSRELVAPIIVPPVIMGDVEMIRNAPFEAH